MNYFLNFSELDNCMKYFSNNQQLMVFCSADYFAINVADP